MSKRQEFVRRAAVPGTNIAALCRAFGIARKTAYKWIARAAADADDPLDNRSRRAKHSPRQIGAAITEEILALRRAYPYWGARKIHALLRQAAPTRSDLPAVSTINRILARNQMIAPAQAHPPLQRFERPAPNDLWQMDFKGYHFVGTDPAVRQKCYPLTVTDDHSRFALCLRACQRMTTEVVQAALIDVFGAYGLPEQMLMDNGPPWGCALEWGQTPLTVWLLRLGIGVLHGRPYHPQTQGKQERFHRTLLRELLAGGRFESVSDAQQQYDAWRPRYNSVRPHEALAMATPVSRYQPSRRAYPERLPAIVYDTPYEVRIVQAKGKISFRGKLWHIGRGFSGQPVGLLPAGPEDLFDVYYCQHKVATVDMRPPQLILT